MRVLGVDQSYTAFGWSLHSALQGHVTKKQGFPAHKYNSDIHRLVDIQGWFTGLVKENKPNLILMEGYAAASKYGRESAGELGAVVKLISYHFGVIPIVVAPTRLKKFVTGKGNSKKNEMLLAVYKRWGEEFTDDNEADAFALAKIGMGILGKTDGLTKNQLEIVKETTP